MNIDLNQVDIFKMLVILNTHKINFLIGNSYNVFTFYKQKFPNKKGKWIGYLNNQKNHLPILSEEYTYENCIDWQFNFETYDLIINVFDGDNVLGFKLDKRCIFKFNFKEEVNSKIDISFLPKEIIQEIILKFNKLIEEIHEKEEFEKKQREKELIKERLLSSINYDLGG